MGWVPCPLTPSPGPPTKSPVSLDPKMFDTGEGGPTVCLEQKGKLQQSCSIQVQGTWFPVEITRNAGEGQRMPVLPREAPARQTGVPQGGLGLSSWGTPPSERIISHI